MMKQEAEALARFVNRYSSRYKAAPLTLSSGILTSPSDAPWAVVFIDLRHSATDGAPRLVADIAEYIENSLDRPTAATPHPELRGLLEEWASFPMADGKPWFAPATPSPQTTARDYPC